MMSALPAGLVRGLRLATQRGSSVAGATEPSSEDLAKNARRKRIAKVRASQDFRISDPVNVIYGTFVLWVGWLSFKCDTSAAAARLRAPSSARVRTLVSKRGVQLMLTVATLHNPCPSQLQRHSRPDEWP